MDRYIAPLIILFLVLGYALLRRWLDQCERAHADRVRLLEEALRNPHIDRQTVENLAYQMTGKRQPGAVGPLLAVVIGIGWVGWFLGIALLVASATRIVPADVVNEVWLGGWVVLSISFGVLTYPMALRELGVRRASN